MLSQLGDDGCDRPMAFFSRKLLPREEKYSTIEKECLAIKLGIENFKVYLVGKKFTVQTDHRLLVCMVKQAEGEEQLTGTLESNFTTV